MNKLFTLVFSAFILISFSACSADNSQSEPTSVPSVEPIAESAVSNDVFETPIDENELLGKWVNDENSVTIEFFDDGTFINDPIDGTYTYNDNTLTLTYGGDQVVEEYAAGIHDGQLVLVRDDFQIILDKAE